MVVACVLGTGVAAEGCVGTTVGADGDALQLASNNTLIRATRLPIIFFIANVSFFFREVFIIIFILKTSFIKIVCPIFLMNTVNRVTLPHECAKLLWSRHRRSLSP